MRTTSVATQAAPSLARRPNASITRINPSTLETKWLSSTSSTGSIAITLTNRRGSDGVAADASSITPAARVRSAAVHGTAAFAAGLRSEKRLIWSLYKRGCPISPQTSVSFSLP